MIGHILYNPNNGEVKFTQARKGAGTGKWEKFIEDGYIPIATVEGRNIRVESLNIPVVKLPTGSPIDNSEINEDKKYKDMKKVIKLKEQDIHRIVKGVLNEQFKNWDEYEQYQQISNTLGPVLKNIIDEHGEVDNKRHIFDMIVTSVDHYIFNVSEDE